MDHDYLDFTRRHQFHQSGAFCVIRGKSNLKIQRRYLRPVDRSIGLVCYKNVVHGGFTHSKILSFCFAEFVKRPTNQLDTDHIDQQLRINNFDDCQTLQVALESWAILQMDQTTSAYQELLWHLRERRQVANLDFDQRLCSSSDRQKTTQLKGQSLSTITDLELNHVWKNPIRSTT